MGAPLPTQNLQPQGSGLTLSNQSCLLTPSSAAKAASTSKVPEVAVSSVVPPMQLTHSEGRPHGPAQLNENPLRMGANPSL